MHWKGRYFFIFMLTAFFIFSTDSDARAVPKATATTICSAKTAVHIRKGPGLKYPVYKTIPRGTRVTKIGTVGSWSIIKLNSSRYYIKTKYLNKLYKYTYVSGSRVNLRTGPGTNYQVKVTLSKNTRLKWVGKSGSWLKIKYHNQVCYISKAFTSTSKSGTTSSGSSKGSGTAGTTSAASIRQKAITAAKQRLGDTYSQAKRNQAGYADCSSLTRDVFLAASGVNIGETTATQISNLVSYKKSLSALQPGDILMKVEKGNNHTAIYIGNNQYIHASSTQKRVIISTYIPNVYWTCCYDAGAYCSARAK